MPTYVFGCFAYYYIAYIGSFDTCQLTKEYGIEHMWQKEGVEKFLRG